MRGASVNNGQNDTVLGLPSWTSAEMRELQAAQVTIWTYLEPGP
jgi:hypothetical protein